MANQQNNTNPAKPEKSPQQDQQQQPKQPQPDENASKQPQQNQQQPKQPQSMPSNPANPSKGEPQQLKGDKSGKDASFAPMEKKSIGAEDESRGKDGGVSPGAQEMQRDKFSGEKMPRH